MTLAAQNGRCELLAAIRRAAGTDTGTDAVRLVHVAANSIADNSTLQSALDCAIFHDRSDIIRILVDRLHATSRGSSDKMRDARNRVTRALPATAEKNGPVSFRAVLDAYSRLWPRAKLPEKALVQAMDRACSWARLDTLRILIDMDVPVQAKNVVSAARSAHGQPVEVSRLLLRHFPASGDVLNEAVAGTTVVGGSSSIKFESRRFLFDEAGADPNSANGQLLRVSSIRGDTTSVLDLLRRGADPRLAGCTMGDGVSLRDAEEVAMHFGHPDTARAIRAHMEHT